MAEWIGLALAWFVRVLTGTQGRWVDCPPSPRQRVYFANHASHLDLLVLWASLPSDVRRLTRPAAAEDYWTRGRLRRWLATRVFRAILVPRPGHGAGLRAALVAVDRAVEGMGDRHSLILFPEGTRGAGEEPGPFRGGLFELARRIPGIELVPVYIENLNRVLPKGELLPLPLVSSISFGRPLVLGEGEGKREFLDRARAAVLALRAA